MKYPQLVSMPSAVSDWLEEQLEARGIDAVVYTRYVLSLLYRDPVDIICPDQDLHITHPNKEVRRAGGGRKRFCRSNDYTYWGRYADADRLKRSAAVECLKSASDQKCGIESLVDELCAKLKDIPNESSTTETKEDTKPIRIPKKVSEKDSAKKYYAAFPALSRTSTTAASSSSSPKLVHLIPKWFGSPKRRLGKKPGSFDGKLHNTYKSQECDLKARSLGKQRLNCNYISRNNRQQIAKNNKEFHKTKRDMAGFNNLKESEFVQDNSVILPSQKLNLEQDMDMRDESLYDDLPVDIRDLLDSPSSPAMHVDLMNLANMTNTGSNKFIQCGTNIISSIWSTNKDGEFTAKNDDDDDVEDKFASHDPYYLDYKFSNIQIDHNLWSSATTPLQLGFLNDRENDNLPDDWSYKMERWSDGFDLESQILKSLLKLNHNPEGSGFAKVKPKNKYPKLLIPEPPIRKLSQTVEEDDANKEDLLVSASSHFKPISEKVEAKPNLYADGTTFAIQANLEEINFQRSETGTMFLQEQGHTKRYLEYKKPTTSETDDLGFKLKFNVNQNDKACQTDMADLEECFEVLYNNLKQDEMYMSGSGKEDYSDAESFSELQRPDSMMAELFGKEHKCEECNSAPSWSQSPSNSTENIWNGEICMTCLRVSSDHHSGSSFKITPLEERQQLREDIKEDGERLLSDLSSYMAEEQQEQEDDLPLDEDACDINTLVYSASGITSGNDNQKCNTEWKQLKIKHNGGLPIHSASFSFATRLQQDCLLKMATIPTLRSVTL